jgi:hypothetical protein
MATVRLSRVSRARYTVPMPPWPMASSRTYGPILTGPRSPLTPGSLTRAETPAPEV